MNSKRSRGNVIVAAIPFVLAFWGMSKLVFDIGRWISTEQKLQVAADAAMVSALRVRVDGLQTLAERWGEIGQNIVQGYSNGQVLVPTARWNHVQIQADALRRSVTGYRGRILAVMNVVLEANELPKASAQLSASLAHELGVTSEAFTIRNETGQTRRVAGGWLRRSWLRSVRQPQPPETSKYQIELSGPSDLMWSPRVVSSARLRWDVDIRSAAIQTRGNGGFPGEWAHSLEGARVNPYRFAVFTTQLMEGGREP